MDEQKDRKEREEREVPKKRSMDEQTMDWKVDSKDSNIDSNDNTITKDLIAGFAQLFGGISNRNAYGLGGFDTSPPNQFQRKTEGNVSDIHESSDRRETPGLRPIIKSGSKYEATLLHSTAPIDSNDCHYENWFTTFTAQRKRYPKPEHIRWADGDDPIVGDNRPKPIAKPITNGSNSGYNGFNEERKEISSTKVCLQYGYRSEPLFNRSNSGSNAFKEESKYSSTTGWPYMGCGSKSMTNASNSDVYEGPREDPWPNRWSQSLDYNSFSPKDFGQRIWDNSSTNYNYFAYKWNENKDQISSKLVSNIWSTNTNAFGSDSPSDQHMTNAEKIIAANQRADMKREASYTWSGQLPRRQRTKHPIYSCKVFLGGIPYDLTDSDLHCTFAQFGPINIQWPGKDLKSAIDGAAANKAGYVYIVFEAYDNVAALLNACTVSYRDLDTGCRWFYEISSRRQKAKEVQVIPFDIGDRFYMRNSFSGQMDHNRTVFVGALHGMLSADGLAKVMEDLFGGVIFAGLDTDKHKYPLGSGRVSFDNQDSYLKAVLAAFVEIKSARFKKKIQIDPYIDNESTCAECRIPIASPVFCRDDFKYFCNKCWDLHQMEPENAKHRPIVKTKPTFT